MNLEMYSRIMNLKKNNDVKVLFAVAGWDFGSGDIFNTIQNKNLRKEFVREATQFIRNHQFDGLDLNCV